MLQILFLLEIVIAKVSSPTLKLPRNGTLTREQACVGVSQLFHRRMSIACLVSVFPSSSIFRKKKKKVHKGYGHLLHRVCIEICLCGMFNMLGLALTHAILDWYSSLSNDG